MYAYIPSLHTFEKNPDHGSFKCPNANFRSFQRFCPVFSGRVRRKAHSRCEHRHTEKISNAGSGTRSHNLLQACRIATQYQWQSLERVSYPLSKKSKKISAPLSGISASLRSGANTFPGNPLHKDQYIHNQLGRRCSLMVAGERLNASRKSCISASQISIEAARQRHSPIKLATKTVADCLLTTPITKAARSSLKVTADPLNS